MCTYKGKSVYVKVKGKSHTNVDKLCVCKNVIASCFQNAENFTQSLQLFLNLQLSFL